MRVSTYSQSQSMLMQIQRVQAQQNDDQRQVTTGRKADTYAGLGHDAASVISAHSLVQRAQGYSDVTTVLASRLTLQQSNLTAIGNSTTTLISTLRSALTTGNGSGIVEAAQSAFSATAQALNSDFGGQYMFAGSSSDTPPFTAASLTALSDPSQPVTAFFADTGAPPSVAVADGLVIKPGIPATDAGQSIMAALKAIREYSATSGPFSATMTDEQRSFVTQQIDALSKAVDGVTDLQAVNGAHQKQIETLQSQHQDTITNASSLLDDLENADLAAAITRLNDDQSRLQALFKMVGELKDVSLLQYL